MFKQTKRKQFNFFRSYYDVYNELNDRDKVAFMNALFDRQFLGIKPTNLEGMAKFAYISQTNSIDSQVKGYEHKTKTKLLAPPADGGNHTPTDGGDNPPTLQEKGKGEGKGEEKEKEKEKEKNILLQQKTEKVFSENILKTYNSCLNFFESHLQPKNTKEKKSWISTIEKLNRIDNIPFQNIIEITKKAREDPFWRKNFLSLNKLRQKKDDLYYITIFNEKFKNYGNNTGKSISEQFLSTMESKAAQNFSFESKNYIGED